MKRLPLWLPVLILVCGLFWWVVLAQSADSIFARVPLLDEAYYLDRAASPGSADPYFVSPLYPWLVRLTGGGGGIPADRVVPAGQLLGLRLFQVLCWMGIVVLLRLLAGRLLPEDLEPRRLQAALRWLPSVMFALYLPGAVYSLTVLLELPAAFLVCLSLWIGLRFFGPDGRTGLSRSRIPAALALGLVLGLAGLLRGSNLVLVPVAMVLAARTGSGQKRLVGPGLILAAALLVLSPAVVHNTRQAGRPVGPTLNAGLNLWIGNGDQANGFYVAVIPGDWRTDPAGTEHLAEAYDLPSVSVAQADSIWMALAVEAMADRPGRAAGLWLKKVWLHLQAWEIDQLTSLAGWRQSIPALGWLPIPYGLIAALGLVGLVAGWRDPRVRFLAICLVSLIAVQSLFFVVSRYRLVLVPVLVLMAPVGVLEMIRHRRVLIGSAAAFLLIMPWGMQGHREQWQAQARANEAVRWLDLGHALGEPSALERSEMLYRQALGGAVEGSAPYLGLAQVLALSGSPAEAEKVLREGIARAGGSRDLLKALLSVLLEDGRIEEAAELVDAVLAAHPRDSDTLHNGSVLKARSGHPEEALSLAMRLMEYHPTDPRGYIDTGILLARSGRPERAREIFERGLQAVPGNPDLIRNLELVR